MGQERIIYHSSFAIVSALSLLAEEEERGAEDQSGVGAGDRPPA
jgi:hypothetical protein